MRDPGTVTVQRAIVHLINHRKQNLICSEAELSFDGDDNRRKLREYFSHQVKNALTDSQTGSARFSADGDQSASQQSYQILANPERLIQSSKELARLLFDAMGTDARINPASLAVCIYTADKYPSTDFLALIKLDPTEALIEKVVNTEKGKQIVTFDVIDDVMPTKEVKLRKAALIPPEGSQKQFDLLLLDRQVAAIAANFFAYTFLNTLPAIDPRTSTETFYLAARNAYNRLVNPPTPELPRINPGEADALQEQIQVALQGNSVNVRTWPAKLPLPKEAKAVVAAELKQEFPEEERIVIDPKHANDKLLKKTRFRGKYGVLFEVESDHYKDVVKEKTEVDRPDGRITRLVLEVPDLQWVKK